MIPTSSEFGAIERLGPARRFVVQVGGSFLAQTVATCLGIAANVLAARWLGVRPFGTIAVALAIVSVASGLCSGLVAAGLTQRLAPGYDRSAVGVGLLLAIAGGLIAGSSILGVSALGVVDLSRVLVPSVVLCVLINIDITASVMLRASGRVVASYVIDAGESGIVLALIVLFHRDLLASSVLWMYTAAASVSVCVTVLLVVGGRGVALRPLRVTSAYLLAFGLPVWVGTTAQLGLLRLPTIVIGSAGGAAAAGQYAIASKVAEGLLLLPAIIASIVGPRSAAISEGEANRTTPIIFRVTLVLSAAGAAALLLMAEMILRALFGDGFAPAAGAIRWLAVGIGLLGPAAVIFADAVQRGARVPFMLASLVGLATAGLSVLVYDPASPSVVAGGVALGCLSMLIGAVVIFGRLSGLGWDHLFVREPRADRSAASSSETTCTSSR